MFFRDSSLNDAVGTALVVLPQIPYSVIGNLAVGYKGDHLLWNRRWEFSLPTSSLGASLGFHMPSDRQYRPLEDRGLRPKPVGYNHSWDRRYYGNFLSDFTSDRDAFRSLRVLNREHGVSHTRLEGVVEPDGASENLVTYVTDGSLFGDVPVTQSSFGHSGFFDRAAVYQSPDLERYFTFSGIGGVSDGSTDFERWPIQPFLDQLVEVAGPGRTLSVLRHATYAWNTYEWSDFRYTLDHPKDGPEVRLQVTYDLLNRSHLTPYFSVGLVPGTYDWYDYRYRVNITVYGKRHDPEPHRYLDTTGTFLMESTMSLNVDHHAELLGTESRYGGDVIPVAPNESCGDYWSALRPIYVTSSSGSGTSSLEFFDAWRGEQGERCRQFEKTVDNLFPQLTPTAFYATADAFENASVALSNNWIETLSELGELKSLLPDVSGAIAVIRRAARKDPAAVIELIDWAAQSYLKYKFGIAPDAAALSEAYEFGGRVVRELINAGGNQVYTVRGKFKWKFPDDLCQKWFGPGTAYLETRAKYRFNYDASSAIGQWLGVRAIGLAPTFNNLWDLVPWSFVIDWFTGLGDRFTDIDNQLAIFCVTTHYTLLSYSIDYYPSDSALAEYHLASVPGKPVKLRAYRRHLSSVAPTIKEGDIDFRQPPDISRKLITLGALLWVNR